jgi:nucleotide-binding universal stress UspA family protein
MIALKNILVATDFSEPSAVALNYGRDLARSYDASLHVVHVMEDLLALHGPEIGFAYSDVQRNIEAGMRRDLDATLSAEDRRTLDARTVITRASNVSHAITKYARDNATDLIIVGTHGRGAIERFLIGSVAERVMRTAPCPVLIVRTNERDFINSEEGSDIVEDYGQEARM